MHPLSSPTTPPSPQLWEPLCFHPPISFFSPSLRALHYMLYGKGCVSEKCIFSFSFTLLLMYIRAFYAHSGSAAAHWLDLS